MGLYKKPLVYGDDQDPFWSMGIPIKYAGEFGHAAVMCPFASATGGNAPSLGISYLLFGNVVIRNYYHAYFLKGLESATTSSTDGFQWQENE